MNWPWYLYDIEVYPNVFTLNMRSLKSGSGRTFEISERRNDIGALVTTINKMRRLPNVKMVGFNNLSYDYPVIHHLLVNLTDWFNDPIVLCDRIYAKSNAIIEAPFHDRFAHVVWGKDQVVPQLDLYKVWHFDNQAKSTSLKVLEFNMRMKDIRDLPFAPGTELTPDQIDMLVPYNAHDVEATAVFLSKSVEHLQFRESLSQKYDRDFWNHNDTKIGKDYFIMRLEQTLGKGACFTSGAEGKKPKQTIRKQIALADVIFPYVSFETPQFQAIHRWMSEQVITQTKAVFTELPESSLGDLAQYSDLKKKKGMVANLNCLLDGMKFIFGTGGIHASFESTMVESGDEWIIVDLDVTSYYPSLAISNRIYPEHLGETFCDIYADMKAQRVTYPKGSPENKMLKLALNGVYGDSNNKYSPFYDPKYTMSITVNGQLLLCMLYEGLRQIEGLSLIQMNTDGLTVKVRRFDLDRVEQVKTWWQLLTGLELEEARYKKMFVRDVNNYLAVYEKGGVKRKGAYEYKVEWHQNHSALVVPKAVEAHLVNGVDVREFIENHEDEWDFLLRTKVPRSSRLMLDWGFEEQQIQNVSRYFISTEGPSLVKVMPPLPKKPDKERRIGINIGCTVHVCNRFEGLDRSLLNVEWYVREAEKLINFEFEGSKEDAGDD